MKINIVKMETKNFHPVEIKILCETEEELVGLNILSKHTFYVNDFLNKLDFPINKRSTIRDFLNNLNSEIRKYI